MKQFKGTKGEWIFEQTDRVDSGLDKFIRNKDNNQIAWVYAETDAQLIAAAPELLEALQGFVNLEDLYMPYGENIKEEHKGEAIALGNALMKAKEAINKALGE